MNVKTTREMKTLRASWKPAAKIFCSKSGTVKMERFSRASSGAILACLLISACVSPTVEIIDRVHVPKGTIDTTDRSIELQERKDFYVPELAVWVSNQFPGARVNGVSLGSNGALAVQIKPENAPINDSPWFAFKLWREGTQMPVEVVLHYTDGTHRYTPKISTDGHVWSDLPADSVTVAEDKSEARFMVEVGPEPLWVAAQEVVAASSVEAWLAGLQRQGCASLSQAGYSANGTPIPRADIGTAGRPAVIVLGRQHPPEVTGMLALFSFVDAICSADDLAERFRSEFTIIVYPLINPDGVREGHWRHNINGVDTNRDWKHFRQPEPRVIRDDLMAADLVDVAFGIAFHSTKRDIFYVVEEDEDPEDYGVVLQWITDTAARVKGYKCVVQPVSSQVPGSSVWLAQALDAPAVTYEAGDTTPRDRINDVANAAADALMELLLTTQLTD